MNIKYGIIDIYIPGNGECIEKGCPIFDQLFEYLLFDLWISRTKFLNIYKLNFGYAKILIIGYSRSEIK